MPFMIETNVLRRILVLVFFIVSMLGPWMFDLINVPAEYDCDKPFVRLYGDFCGYPMSGFETVKWAAGGFFSLLDGLTNGTAGSAELILLICMSIVILPFFSSLLLIGYRNSRRLQSMNVIVWGLACLPTLTLFIVQSNRDQFVQFFLLLWGLWLYILLAIGTFIIEMFVWRWNIEPTKST